MYRTNNEQHANQQSSDNKIDLKEVFKTIRDYKWLIIIMTFSALFLMAVTLYFKPSIYSSHAIIEIKASGKQNSNMNGNDFLANAFAAYGKEQIDKEIEILKTFYINNQALNKVDFKTKYYIDNKYKQSELYNNVPIKITQINTFNNAILGKKITLIPQEEGFKLTIQNSLEAKANNLLFSEELLTLDSTTIHPYNKEIKTPYFSLTINKNKEFKHPIYFKIYGDNRYVYEKIVQLNLNISQVNKNAPLIKIEYQDNIPARADAYVNAIAESFIAESINTKNEQNDKILSFIEEQLQVTKERLKESEDKLEKYKISEDVIQPSLQAEMFIKESSNVEIELSENKLKERLIENLISFVKHNNNLDAIAPSLMELQDKPTLELISSLQRLQLEEDELSAEYTNQFPKLLSVRKQIGNIKQKISLNLTNLKSSIAHKNINLIQQQKSYEERLRTLPTQEKKLINIKRDYEVGSKMYAYLLEKRAENEIIKVATLSDYKIIDRAYSASNPVSPKRTLMMLIATIVGLILGMLIAFLLKAMNNKIHNKQDIENLTSLPIYGIIPQLKQKSVKLEVYNAPKSPFAESYRSLRTNLQFVKKKDQANVIVITSTVPGEGKTTTTANLCSVFQMAGYKSIVINLDLRKPTLHTYFDIKHHRGMSTYLSGKDEISDIIFSTEHSNLDIIVAGPIPPNPSELILSERLPKLLDTLKERYDYIFIDTAPIGLVTDTMYLMQYADLTLVVFRENHAEKSFITDLNGLIEKNNLSRIGVILNGSQTSSGSYGYGYGYGYGYEK